MKVENKKIENQVTFDLQQLIIPPGQRVQLTGISWEMYETILEVLGESRAARLTYCQGILEIRMPLPKHERAKSLIGYLVNVLLEELEIDCECYASTTFKRQDMLRGVEPDDSFYIQNEPAVRGKMELDLNQIPPPDLAIEVDITSKTELDAYQGLGIPELWIYDGSQLKIYLLQSGKYIQSNVSNIFPDLPISEKISQALEESKTLGRSATIRAFRSWVRKQKENQ